MRATLRKLAPGLLHESIVSDKVSSSAASGDDEEKNAYDIQSGDVKSIDNADSAANRSHDPDSGQERKLRDKMLMRKIDWHLLPWLSLLYLLSNLDRGNIGNAKIYGIIDDLQMSNGQYSAALSLFYISYSFFEPLTNVLLKRWSPRMFLTISMVIWGIVMTTMGLVHDFSGFAAARWFLGVAEAGLFPGINYYLSCWYKRSELGLRAAIFFSAAALAGSFSGLLAAAIAQMNGIGGKAGWSWIFILEGLLTILIGVLSFWMVYNFPSEARFLNDNERARVLHRLRADNQASAEDEQFDMKFFWMGVTDPKTYLYALQYMGVGCSAGSFALFLPSIIKELGYSSTQANLLSVPPYVAAAGTTVLVGWLADRYGNRSLFNIGSSLFAVVGFAMLLASNNVGVKYAGTFFGAMGIYPCAPNTIVWASNNLEGVYKRGVSLGILIGFGNLNAVVSSNVYRDQDAPEYYLGNGVTLAYLAVFIAGSSAVTRTYLQRENRKKMAGERDNRVEGKNKQEIRDLGDLRPDFLYTL